MLYFYLQFWKAGLSAGWGKEKAFLLRSYQNKSFAMALSTASMEQMKSDAVRFYWCLNEFKM